MVTGRKWLASLPPLIPLPSPPCLSVSLCLRWPECFPGVAGRGHGIGRLWASCTTLTPKIMQMVTMIEVSLRVRQQVKHHLSGLLLTSGALEEGYWWRSGWGNGLDVKHCCMLLATKVACIQIPGRTPHPTPLINSTMCPERPLEIGGRRGL